MEPILLFLLIASPSATPDPTNSTFKTAKSLQQLEQCLTAHLSKQGDVTAVQAEGYVTLVYQDSTHRPMMIDLAPPNVMVTTDLAFGTRKIIQSCL
jgi:hypothetical protein